MFYEETDQESEEYGPWPWNPEHLAIVKQGAVRIEEWRKANPGVEFLLRRADLSEVHHGNAKRKYGLGGADLTDANLERANLNNTFLNNADLSGANLQGATLDGAKLQGAKLIGTNLDEADLCTADLSGARMVHVHLTSARLHGATMPNVRLARARLQKAILYDTNLENARLDEAHLEEADLSEARLEGAILDRCYLERSVFRYASVDGRTLIRPETTDGNTDFTGVGLDAARIPPEVKADLQYNIRRLHWKTIYQMWKWWHPKTWLTQFFWCLSDYGHSTKRLIYWFAGFASLFAIIYATPHIINSAPLVANLEVCESANKATIDVGARGMHHLLARSLYFSIVTMTTLGFGDMYANPENPLGYLFLGTQVMIGYVLLGALITRLSIHFQSVK